MKQFYLIIIYTLFTLKVFSQSSNSVSGPTYLTDSSRTLKYYNNLNNWSFSSKMEYKYDQFGRDTSIIINGIDTNGVAYRLKTNKTYVSNQIRSIKYSEFKSNKWEEMSRTDFEFNNNLIVSEETYINNNGTLEKSTSVEYLYNSNSKLETENHYVYVGAASLVVKRISYTYFGNGLLESKITELDNGFATLENTIRERYTYNTSQRIRTYSLDYWDVSDWVNNEILRMGYSGSLLTADTLYKNEKGNYVLTFRNQYTYNSNQQITRQSRLSLYNGNFYNDLISRYYYDVNKNNIAFSKKYVDPLGKLLFDSDSVLNFYSLKNIVGIENDLSENIKIYPNPSSQYITIDSENKISSCIIYNMEGKVLIKQFQNTNIIDIRNLEKGNYIIQISDEKGNLINKQFIKN